MGVSPSKTSLERRNTVLRRSQRKSIHGIKSKADKIIKDIRKFKGTTEDSNYQELKKRTEIAERELKGHLRTLQPQIQQIYNLTLKKIEECYKLLKDKLRENQEKENKDVSENEDVEVEEIEDEATTTNQKETVEVNIVQLEPIESSPQINKRFSAMKIGVPVLPGSIMEANFKKNDELEIESIHKRIQDLEIEISKFVGRKNGSHYDQIKQHLEECNNKLRTISCTDEEIEEQARQCSRYINSCLSFLDEKATEEVDGEQDYDEVFEPEPESINSNLSPKSVRTTYI